MVILVWFDIYAYNCIKETFGIKKKDNKDNKGYLDIEIWEYYDTYKEDHINKNVEKNTIIEI